jgi:hypothetical protein
VQKLQQEHQKMAKQMADEKQKQQIEQKRVQQQTIRRSTIDPNRV